MTRFEVGDLLRIKPEAQSYDLVLCRNTVIYFDDHVRNELHARLAASLRPGGVMVIGATERIIRARSLALQPVHPFIFRKT
jgi:chemotaxis protein methyltransferase CheR